MKRWHQELHITKRNWKNHINMHIKGNVDNVFGRIGQDPTEVDCVCDKQMGRFRKKDAYDCGRTRCYLCHSDKLMNYLTRAELRADIDFKEQLKDL